jgi:hypothetical protein
MGHQENMAENARIRSQKDMVIRVVRLSGLAFIVAGLAVLFNLGNISEIVGLNDDINKLLGGVLMMIGLVDIIAVPRALGHKKTI